MSPNEEPIQPMPSDPHETPNGLEAFSRLGAFLEKDGWYARRMENKTAYMANFAGKNCEIRCFAFIRTDLEQFLFYAQAPVKAPETVRTALAEFITRANYGLRIGNFEMDYADGEMRYKTSLDFEGEALNEHWIHNTIYPAVQMMDQYLPGLMRVAFGGATPLEAIQEIEGVQS